MPDIFDELNEDLRAERARALMKRYGGLGVAALVLVLACVGGWQGWEWRQRQQAAAAAGPYLAAMHEADALPGGPSAQATADAEAFAKVAATAPEGYRTLARLREAALRWDSGDSTGALALWDQLGADTNADPVLRDLGSLLWAQHSVDQGNPADITARTAKLEAAGSPWRPLAQEVDALVALRQDDKEKAARTLRLLVADPLAAEGLRGRASALLTLLGAPAEARG